MFDPTWRLMFPKEDPLSKQGGGGVEEWWQNEVTLTVVCTWHYELWILDIGPVKATILSAIFVPGLGSAPYIAWLCGRENESTFNAGIYNIDIVIFTFTFPLTAGVVGATQMTSQPVCSFLFCSLLSETWRTAGLSIPWCCLPTSLLSALSSSPLHFNLMRWFWPDMMNGKHVRTTSIGVSLRW